MSLSLENDLSPDATVTGMVRKILRAIKRFGNAVDLLLQARNSSIFTGFCNSSNGIIGFIASMFSQSMKPSISAIVVVVTLSAAWTNLESVKALSKFAAHFLMVFLGIS